MKKCIFLLAVVLSISWVTTVFAQNSEKTGNAPKADQAYNWTGVYFGLNAGYGFGGGNSFSFVPISANWLPAYNAGAVASPNSLNPSGFIGGGQIGYNYQVNKYVLVGLEADIQSASIRDSKSQGTQATGFVPVETDIDQQLDWLGTVRLRAGFLPLDRLLLYATGGLAYGKVERSATVSAPADLQIFGGSSSDTKSGWTIGCGVEWAFWGNWSVKGEYLYYNLGEEDVDIVTIAGPAAAASGTFDTKGNIIRAGVNYKF